MKSRRFLSGSLAICGLLAPQIAAFAASPALVAGRSRFARYEGEDKEPTLDELRSQLAAATSERDKFKGDYDKLSTTHTEVSGKLKTFEDSQKTEGQRIADEKAAAESRASTAEGAAKQARTQLAVERKARALGIQDEDAAYRLLDHSKIEYAEDGTAKNIDSLLEQLAKDKPYLVGTTGGAGGSNANPHNPGRTRGGGLTLEQISRMTPAEINANLPAVNAALAAGK